MLGLGKKKKKDKGETPSPKKDLSEKKSSKKPKKKKDKGKLDSQDTLEKKAPEKKKKKWVSKKQILIILVVLLALGAASYVVYTLYLTPKNPGGQKAIYEKIELKHINLPDEMLKFSFEYFPDLYNSMITFNNEMDLFDKEIARIDAIAQKYPDQKKIADKEKNTWGKAKNALQKAFLKIEKPIKETYVLFSVNKELGLAQIESKNKELTDLALSSLLPAQDLTRKLKSNEKIPTGFINGNIYKLKKKFL